MIAINQSKHNGYTLENCGTHCVDWEGASWSSLKLVFCSVMTICLLLCGSIILSLHVSMFFPLITAL